MIATSSRTGLFSIAVLALGVVPRPVVAAEEELPALTAPSLAPYPSALRGSGALGTVEVSVEVDGTGRVLEAGVLARTNPALEAAALGAARGLRFSPGRRARSLGGFSAVVAYTFRHEGSAAGQLASVFFPERVSLISKAATSPLGAQLVAVAVGAEEARRVPGTQGDIVKVVENLPGVGRAGLATGDLILWGAAPVESRVMVDGIEIPTLFHVGGLRSVLPSPLVADVDVAPGAYGAAYGRALGGLVRVQTAGLHAGVHGAASVDPLDATAYLGASLGPLRIGGAWREGLLHRFVGGDARRADHLLAIPAIRDQQLKASAVLSDDEEVQALFLRSSDRLARTAPSLDPADARTESLARRFWRAGVRYLREPATGSSAEAVAWVGTDESRRELRFGPVPATIDVATTSFGLRSFRREPLTSRAALGVGLDGLLARANVGRAGSLTVPAREGDAAVFGQPPGADVNADRWQTTSVAIAPFATAELELGHLTASGGARLEAFGMEASRVTPRVGATPGIGSRRLDWALDPRLALSYEVRPWLRLTTGGGRYHQLPSPEDLSAVFGTPSLGPARADHAAVGITVQGDQRFSASVTAYGKRLAGLAARDPAPAPPLARVLTDRGTGRATGVQVLLRLAGEQRFTGWLAYTLGRGQRDGGDGRASRPADFDQTHVLTAVAGYRIGPWAMGGRCRLATGFPRTPVVGAYYDAQTDRFSPLFGAPNSTRLPTFFQLDLRVERTFAIADTWGAVDLYGELLNVTARRNAEELAYNHDYSVQEPITGLPLLAMAGARLRF